MSVLGMSMASVFTGSLFSCATIPEISPKNENILKGVLIIDAHAHPGRGSIGDMQHLGMEASSFSTVGDRVYLSRGKLKMSEFDSTFLQLRRGPKIKVTLDMVKLVLKAADIPNSIGWTDPPGAILAIEGGDPLEGNPDMVDFFYDHGIRMITVIHRHNNEIGDSMNPMTPENWHGGLTPTGRKIIERMQDLGMIVDVAHAHKRTLRQIAEISSAPLVDSHTNPGHGHRQRSWKEMEQVAKTGGVICTWPQAFPGRSTFRSWAKEILKMKQRLGMEHVGLGMDSGGLIDCKLINGYSDIRDLVYLAAEMQEMSLSREDIAAYMGGNFYRVFEQCVG